MFFKVHKRPKSVSKIGLCVLEYMSQYSAGAPTPRLTDIQQYVRQQGYTKGVNDVEFKALLDTLHNMGLIKVGYLLGGSIYQVESTNDGALYYHNISKDLTPINAPLTTWSAVKAFFLSLNHILALCFAALVSLITVLLYFGISPANLFGVIVVSNLLAGFIDFTLL
jgi:hypothetical protein